MQRNGNRKRKVKVLPRQDNNSKAYNAFGVLYGILLASRYHKLKERAPRIYEDNAEAIIELIQPPNLTNNALIN